jgi:hypothetical protein
MCANAPVTQASEKCHARSNYCRLADSCDRFGCGRLVGLDNFFGLGRGIHRRSRDWLGVFEVDWAASVGAIIATGEILELSERLFSSRGNG